jgi:hypothetical protein
MTFPRSFVEVGDDLDLQAEKHLDYPAVWLYSSLEELILLLVLY